MNQVSILTTISILTIIISSTSFGQVKLHSNLYLEPKGSQKLIKHYLTLTRVKKPWFAWRSLVVNRFKKSIPEYASISGLEYKSYHISEDGKIFGGIYVWESKEKAMAWFNQRWFERVERTYKVPGIVDFYLVSQIETIQEVTNPLKRYWAVLQKYVPASSINIPIKGLVKVLYIESDNHRMGNITFWDSKNAAKAYFKDQNVEGFDILLLLKNK